MEKQRYKIDITEPKTTRAIAYVGRGLAWVAKHDLDYAMADFTDAIRLDPDGWIVSLKASSKSPMRRRSTPVQQPSRRERECARADARHAPAPVRSVHDAA